MKRRRRFLNRRTFIGTAALAAAGGAWVGTSSSWTAQFFRERIAEIGRKVPAAAHKPTPRKWNDNAVTIAWLGHATVLINFFGVRILTDPAFFPRIGVDLALGTLGPKRLTACALQPEELPDIDLVIVSHAHFDHLDTPSLASIPGKPIAMMASETSDLLPRKNYSAVHELGWGASKMLKTGRGDVLVRGLEVKHWGARIRRDQHRGYNGFTIEREGVKLLFGGDTANTPLFAEYRKFGPFAAAIMPVGAYDPWIHSHCTPEQAVQMANAARARFFIPIHHQAFKLSRESFGEPIERATLALAAEPERLVIKRVGETAKVT